MNILKTEGPFSEVAGFALGFVPTAIVMIIIIVVYKRRQISNEGTCFCLKRKAYHPNNDVYENNSEVAHTIELSATGNTDINVGPNDQYEALNFDDPKENVYLDVNQEPELSSYENTGMHARPTAQYEALNFDDPKENVYLDANQEPELSTYENTGMHAPTAQYEALIFDDPKENVYLDANQEPDGEPQRNERVC